MYVKLDKNVPSEWPVTIARIKHDNKDVSFPRDMSNFDVSSFGFGNFKYADEPEHDPEYQNCTEQTPVLTDGVYVQTWKVTDKYTSEEKKVYDAKKEEDRLKALPEINRNKRNSLLAETDWMAGSDVTMSNEWKTYRQALRDLPTHSSWPDLKDEDWPTKPS